MLLFVKSSSTNLIINFSLFLIIFFSKKIIHLFFYFYNSLPKYDL